jgi:hypothetical protein
MVLNPRFHRRGIELDEIWGFIGKKKKNASLDADTKLIPFFLVQQEIGKP